jgi:hypothetical protein
VGALAPNIDGEFLSAFIRVVKPWGKPCHQLPLFPLRLTLERLFRTISDTRTA